MCLSILALHEYLLIADGDLVSSENIVDTKVFQPALDLYEMLFNPVTDLTFGRENFKF